MTNLDKYNKKILFLFVISLAIIIISMTFLRNSLKEKETPLTQKEFIEKVSADFKESHLSGSVALVKNGKIIDTSSYGFSDKEQNVKNTDNELYPIASLQKNMTGVIIGQLIREDKLTYDTTINTFYPDLEFADTITIRDLLNHTSGYGMPETATDSVLKTEKEQLENIFDSLYYHGSHEFYYSNGNYSLLAGIISQIENKSYKESLKTRIFKPLKLEHTFLWDDLPKEATIPNEYLFYNDEDYNTENLQYSEELMSTLLGAGNVYSTVSDLSRFEMSLNNGTLLTEDEFNELFNYSLQQEVMFSGNISADGVMGGYRSYVYGDLSEQNFIVFLANQSSDYYPYDLLADVYQQLLLF